MLPVLEIAQDAGWVSRNRAGEYHLSAAGELLASQPTPAAALREMVIQLVVDLRPSWTKLAMRGRAAVLEYAPPEVVQCLVESGLAHSIDPATVGWWDRFSLADRSETDQDRLDEGRRGERLSYEYECLRTGSVPRWDGDAIPWTAIVEAVPVMPQPKLFDTRYSLLIDLPADTGHAPFLHEDGWIAGQAQVVIRSDRVLHRTNCVDPIHSCPLCWIRPGSGSRVRLGSHAGECSATVVLFCTMAASSASSATTRFQLTAFGRANCVASYENRRRGM